MGGYGTSGGRFDECELDWPRRGQKRGGRLGWVECPGIGNARYHAGAFAAA